MATMKNKQVSFNVDNLDENELLAFVSQFKNFSGYVKELIKKDMVVKQKKPDVTKTSGNGVTIKVGK